MTCALVVLQSHKIFMPKYSRASQTKVKKTMHEYKEGTLKSGSGKKVKSRKQAIAIGLSEARKKGAKVPKKSAKKQAAKKSAKKSSRKTARKTSAKSSS
jgi:hypothetical protein